MADLGTPTRPVTTPKPGPKIPRSLQGRVINVLGSETSGFGTDYAFRTYGKWRVKLLKDFRFFNVSGKVGDFMTIPGNVAAEFAQAGVLEFCDPRQAEEERVALEAERLNLPQPIRSNVAFQNVLR